MIYSKVVSQLTNILLNFLSFLVVGHHPKLSGSGQHCIVLAAAARLEGGLDQTTRLRKPEQSRPLFRQNFLGPEL
jgi:hypothetical protein